MKLRVVGVNFPFTKTQYHILAENLEMDEAFELMEILQSKDGLHLAFYGNFRLSGYHFIENREQFDKQFYLWGDCEFYAHVETGLNYIVLESMEKQRVEKEYIPDDVYRQEYVVSIISRDEQFHSFYLGILSFRELYNFINLMDKIYEEILFAHLSRGFFWKEFENYSPRSYIQIHSVESFRKIKSVNGELYGETIYTRLKSD